jgi:hypothetical protein
LGDERRVRARDPRRPRAIEVTTSCVPSAVPAADLRFGGVVGPSWFLRAAGDFPHDASEFTRRPNPKLGKNRLTAHALTGLQRGRLTMYDNACNFGARNS